MEFKNKKIGIWGFGAVGKSAIVFLTNLGATVKVIEKRILEDEEKKLMDIHSVSYIKQTDETIKNFLDEHDYIVASPGIDLRQHTDYEHKWLTELDIFGQFFQKPTIMVTGTVGKTSVVTLLSEILKQQGKKVLVGGNIGTPMLDLIAHQDECDLAVIELSSFQLAYSKSCASSLTIWTNLYPNHLDWHGTIKEYMSAKLKSIRFQCANKQALLPLVLRDFIKDEDIKSSLSFFSHTAIAHDLKLSEPLYILENNRIIKLLNDQKYEIAQINSLPSISFPQNWLIILATLDLLKAPITSEIDEIDSKKLLEHRLEHVGNINGIDFYNDSKATVIQATLSAVSSFRLRNVILLLGGMSKGVNRSSLIKDLPANVSHIICFGKEAIELYKQCAMMNREANCFSTLEEAYEYSLLKAKKGDVILLSPGGTSYDLFPNYQARGKRFKELVLKYSQRNKNSK